MLILARKKDEKITLTIGGHTTIELMVVSVGNSVARIGIEAPHEVKVLRNELIEPAAEPVRRGTKWLRYSKPLGEREKEELFQNTTS